MENSNNTFKDRLLAEQKELLERSSKLGGFIHTAKYQELPEVQQALLIVQLNAMVTYNSCLEQRIKYLD